MATSGVLGQGRDDDDSYCCFPVASLLLGWAGLGCRGCWVDWNGADGMAGVDWCLAVGWHGVTTRRRRRRRRGRLLGRWKGDGEREKEKQELGKLAAALGRVKVSFRSKSRKSKLSRSAPLQRAVDSAPKVRTDV